MVMTYKDLSEKGYSDYRIKQLLLSNNLFMIEKGLYSTSKENDNLEIISKKHPNAIITLQSACYCYRLLDKEPYPCIIATKQKDRKINDKMIKQIFMSDKYYNIGVNIIKYKGFNIKIYDLERLLIEVIRYKTKLDYDIYIKIVNNYKKIKKLLKKEKILNYLEIFNDQKLIDRLKKDFFEI